MSAAVNYGALLAVEPPEVIHSDEQNRQYLKRLENLITRDDLSPAEEKLIELLTLLVRDYERKRYEIESASGIEVLRHLIDLHNLKQKDLVPSVFESESVASAVLNGSREMTIRHIRRAAQQFDLPSNVFMGE